MKPLDLSLIKLCDWYIAEGGMDLLTDLEQVIVRAVREGDPLDVTTCAALIHLAYHTDRLSEQLALVHERGRNVTAHHNTGEHIFCCNYGCWCVETSIAARRCDACEEQPLELWDGALLELRRDLESSAGWHLREMERRAA